jgi:hypothetical protein
VMPLKQFYTEVGQRLGMKPQATYMRIIRGSWPQPKMTRLNQRVVLVRTRVEDYLRSLSRKAS